MIFKMKHYTLLGFTGFLLFCTLSWQACKKDKGVAPPTKDTVVTSTPPSKEDLLKDSVYLLMQDYYFWYKFLPTNFNPRSYNKAEEVLDALKSYPVDATGYKLDRYSFLDRSRALSKEIGQGQSSGDFGFMFKYIDINDLRVSYVYANSPAGQKGIQRGWQVVKVNGNPNIAYDGADVGGNSTNLNFVINALYSSNATFTFKKPDGTTQDVALTSAVYKINSVLYSNTYGVNGKKVGYIVFNQFLGQPAIDELTPIFTDFISKGVNELILDLRYNGGGSVSTAMFVDNVIAPASANNQLMFSYEYNDKLTNYFKNDYPKQTGKQWNFDYKFDLSSKPNLNLGRVIFLVGSGTASASELTINNLKPYMDVKLIGRTTYGKPVGFFALPIMDADLYAVNFRTVNAQKAGDYYKGMGVDYAVKDSIVTNWGDPNEKLLKAALNYIGTGSFGRMSSQSATNNILEDKMNNRFDDLNFKGIVDFRRPFPFNKQ